jgi:DNA-binding winged helix-turn-helix (wHTH) protein/TolB-like protein/tetratricopeptide (TPR) repeat protein
LIRARRADIFAIGSVPLRADVRMTGKQEQPSRRLTLGEWTVDPARDVLARDGESVKIEPKAMEVLVFLANRPGAVVAQRDLEAAVWRDVIVTPQSVYQSIAQLRRVLGDDARQPRYIETVPRRGYRLVAPVQWIEEQPTRVPASQSAEVAIETTPAANRPRDRRWLAAAGVVLLLVATLTGAAFMNRSAQSEAPKSIAVLTFQNGAGDTDSDYLAEAITEELVNALGQVEGLRVLARTSTRAAEKVSTDPREVAEQLDVTHVLEGSVRRVEGRVRVMATLVDGRTGYHEWSRSFERPAANLLRLPTDVAGSAASALRLVLVGDAGVGGSRIGTRNPTAYDYYMLGQQRAAERTGFGLAEAERYFQQALEADGQFAAAYAALADVYVAEFFYANRPRSEAFDLATPLLERSLELDAKFGFARALQGLLSLELGDYPRAAEELTQAAVLAPNEAKTQLWLGGAWFSQGRLERALTAFDRGLELDPLNFILHGRRAVLLQSMGRRAEADESVTRAVTLAPRHPNPRWVLALIANWRGDTRQSIAHYESALALDGARSDLRLELGQRLLEAGDRAGARAAFATAARQARGSALYLEAVAYQAIESGSFGELSALAESMASIDATNLFYLRDAAGFMLLAGDPAKAATLYERATAINRAATLDDVRELSGGTSYAALQLAVAYRATGREADAARVLDEQTAFIDQAEAWGLRCWGTHYQRAAIAALRGQQAAALEHLERAAQAGWRQAWWARIDPALASLRIAPGFDATLERLTGN